MLKPVLRKALLPEHRIIYDMKIRLTDDTLRDKIVSSVRHIRKTNRRNGVNTLEAKLDRFGNSGGWYLTRVKELVKKIYNQKPIPKDSIGRWRSIEFELVFRSNEACEEFTYAVRSAGLSEFVTIQDDDSIRRNDYDTTGLPHEVTLSYRAGNEEAVRNFCKCLKGRAYVNWSCGTHFHIDMRHLDQDKVTEYGNRLAVAVPALRLLLPKDRRDNKYCKTIINTTKTSCVKCGKLSCNCHVQPHKYAFINLAAYNKHKTIEIRGHSGTINADKILNWIKLCEHIMLTPPINGQIASVEELIEKYRLDKELSAYVKDRFMRFNDEIDWTNSYWASTSNKHYKTEEEENPADHVEVPVHPAFLAPIPAAKSAQVAKAKIAQPHVFVIGTNS